MSKIYEVPTHHLRFVKRLTTEPNTELPFGVYKYRLQQKWDTSKLIEGIWTITSTWRDVQVEDELNVITS